MRGVITVRQRLKNGTFDCCPASCGSRPVLHGRFPQHPWGRRPADFQDFWEYPLSWFQNTRRNGVRLCCSRRSAALQSWLRLCAGVREENVVPWRQLENGCVGIALRDFPSNGLPDEKILFAIRRHCHDTGSNDFFLGARDAGLVAGVSYITAWRMLNKLCRDGCIRRTGTHRQPRHAQTFQLIKP